MHESHRTHEELTVRIITCMRLIFLIKDRIAGPNFFGDHVRHVGQSEDNLPKTEQKTLSIFMDLNKATRQTVIRVDTPAFLPLQ